MTHNFVTNSNILFVLNEPSLFHKLQFLFLLFLKMKSNI